MKRALILACPVVLVLGLVACGDDDDDTPATSATATTEGLSDATVLPGGTALPGGTVLPGGTILPGGSVLPGDTLPGGITIPDLSDLSIPDLGDVSIPANAGEVLKQVFPKLTDKQINCLVDALGEDLDPTKVPAMMRTCDIAAADLIPG